MTQLPTATTKPERRIPKMRTYTQIIVFFVCLFGITSFCMFWPKVYRYLHNRKERNQSAQAPVPFYPDSDDDPDIDRRRQEATKRLTLMAGNEPGGDRIKMKDMGRGGEIGRSYVVYHEDKTEDFEREDATDDRARLLPGGDLGDGNVRNRRSVSPHSDEEDNQPRVQAWDPILERW